MLFFVGSIVSKRREVSNAAELDKFQITLSTNKVSEIVKDLLERENSVIVRFEAVLKPGVNVRVTCILFIGFRYDIEGLESLTKGASNNRSDSRGFLSWNIITFIELCFDFLVRDKGATRSTLGTVIVCLAWGEEI